MEQKAEGAVRDGSMSGRKEVSRQQLQTHRVCRIINCIICSPPAHTVHTGAIFQQSCSQPVLGPVC